MASINHRPDFQRGPRKRQRNENVLNVEIPEASDLENCEILLNTVENLMFNGDLDTLDPEYVKKIESTHADYLRLIEQNPHLQAGKSTVQRPANSESQRLPPAKPGLFQLYCKFIFKCGNGALSGVMLTSLKS